MPQNVRDYTIYLGNNLILNSEVWKTNTSKNEVKSKDFLSNVIYTNENKKMSNSLTVYLFTTRIQLHLMKK